MDQLAYFGFSDGTGELVEIYSQPFMHDLGNGNGKTLCVELRWLRLPWNDIAGCARIIPIGKVAKELLRL
jgi:hypothetical protein